MSVLEFSKILEKTYKAAFLKLINKLIFNTGINIFHFGENRNIDKLPNS